MKIHYGEHCAVLIVYCTLCL